MKKKSSKAHGKSRKYTRNSSERWKMFLDFAHHKLRRREHVFFLRVNFQSHQDRFDYHKIKTCCSSWFLRFLYFFIALAWENPAMEKKLLSSHARKNLSNKIYHDWQIEINQRTIDEWWWFWDDANELSKPSMNSWSHAKKSKSKSSPNSSDDINSDDDILLHSTVRLSQEKTKLSRLDNDRDEVESVWWCRWETSTATL